MRALKSRYVAVAASAAILGSAALASAGQVAIIQPGSNQAAGELLEPRWLPWLGCWELFADAVGYRETEGTGRRVVCVNPRPDGRGVTMTAHLDGAVAGQDTVLADGRDHPTQESGCEGWQRSLWSADGHRLYNEAASACEGGANRTLAGINMLVESDRWLELQSMSLDGGEHREMVIRHYRRLADSALSDFGFVPMALELTITAATARAAASGPLDIGDVLEIDERLPLEVTEAAILESNSQFSLDSKELIKLADSGLEERVIDLMVAVSFPDRFLVDSGSRSGGGGGGGYAGIGVYGPSCYASFRGSYYSPYTSLYCSPRYYDPYYRGGYYGGGGVPVRVPKGGSLFGGKVLAGRGYARVRARPEPVDGGGGRAFSRGLFGSGNGRSGGGSGSSSSSGGSAKSSVGPSGFGKGGSSGGSAKPKGGSKRKAKPRGDKER